MTTNNCVQISRFQQMLIEFQTTWMQHLQIAKLSEILINVKCKLQNVWMVSEYYLYHLFLSPRTDTYRSHNVGMETINKMKYSHSEQI